jgi:hypothetical protein
LALNIADINNPIVCGNKDTNKFSIVMLYTITPWIFILALGHVLLNVFPGWLRIFSNTIGIYLAYQKYEDDLTNNFQDEIKGILGQPPTAIGSQEQIYILSESLNRPKLILNEIDSIGKTAEEQHNMYVNYLNKLHPSLFKIDKGSVELNRKYRTFFKDDGTLIDEMTDREYKLLSIINNKNDIGRGIWYILFGVIAVMISTNSIISSNCGADI